MKTLISITAMALCIGMTGCELNKESFTQESAEKLLQQNRWYSADEYSDKYIGYIFNGSSYSENYYKDRDFRIIKNSKYGTISNYNGDTFNLNINSKNYNCESCFGDIKDGYNILSCVEDNGVGSFYVTIWKSKELANSH